MKHYKLVDFFSNLNVKPPLHERKAPLLLTTFWRRFWFEQDPIDTVLSANRLHVAYFCI